MNNVGNNFRSRRLRCTHPIANPISLATVPGDRQLLATDDRTKRYCTEYRKQRHRPWTTVRLLRVRDRCWRTETRQQLENDARWVWKFWRVPPSLNCSRKMQLHISKTTETHLYEFYCVHVYVHSSSLGQVARAHIPATNKTGFSVLRFIEAMYVANYSGRGTSKLFIQIELSKSWRYKINQPCSSNTCTW